MNGILYIKFPYRHRITTNHAEVRKGRTNPTDQ